MKVESADVREGKTPDMKHKVADQSYELVLSKETLEHWVDEAVRVGFLGLDVHATGEDASSADIIGVSLGMRDGRSCYVPLAHSKSVSQSNDRGCILWALLVGRFFGCTLWVFVRTFGVFGCAL